MNANDIRRRFLDFFKNKGHQIVPSAPLVVKDDPTLMFTNAGMNQFKDYFLGTKQPASTRIADTQKCLRVSGKHNDLEEVGHDTYHHTMFEMLGNWSFGDYFKKEAIEWAWELLTREYGLPESSMYVTVFGGDDQEHLERDDEAYDYWKKILPEERILYGSKKDNFWEMGDMGPCGPCSEIHIDLRPEEERAGTPGRDLVNKDHPLVIEIWNLVFIQYNRKADGSLENLPQKHVDTGMGFERLVMAVEGKTSNYDTDVFSPLIEWVCNKAGIRYGQDEEKDVAVRVIVDHVRAVAFAIADGQLPSNTGAGYVIRRILRRAVRYGFNYLHFGEPFLYQLTGILAVQMGEVFPEIRQQETFIKRVIEEEEQSFLRTLENGIKLFEEELRRVKTRGIRNERGKLLLSGEVAFRLYDTFGFPIDLTRLLAREQGVDIDMKEFEEYMNRQKERSRTAADQEEGDWVVLDGETPVTFTGYDQTETVARILRYKKVKTKKGSKYLIVLDKTPFYAESGGQVGDTGYLEAEGKRIPVVDTQKENELIVHITPSLPEDPTMEFRCVVDVEKRQKTACNHSGTHLLHAALRRVLGEHVQQRGSLVNDKMLRFDFSHFGKMTREEIDRVERMVNARIRQDIPLDEKRAIPIEKAREMGAMALFGEKYGEKVRVITFDPEYSVEFCGGIHVRRTGEIGILKIISESSVAAGIRRIEAMTGEGAELYIDEKLKVLSEVEQMFNKPKDLPKVISGLVEERSHLAKEIEKLRYEKVLQIKEELLKSAVKKGDATVIIARTTLPGTDALKRISYELKNQVKGLYLVLAADINGKPQISVMFDDELVEKHGLHAGKMIRELAVEIRGGGGGQPFFATAGGKDLPGLDRVVVKAEKLAEEQGFTD